MKCPNCGGEVLQGMPMCPRCGQRFSTQAQRGKYCVHCKAVIPANAAVCPKCGKQQPQQAVQGAQKQTAGKQAKAKKKGGFRWWQILLALVIFMLGFGAGSIVNSDFTPSTVAKKSDATESEPVNLDGLWSQVNSSSKSAYQMAAISGDIIEIRWVDDDSDTQSLYWAGTVKIPKDPGTKFSWDSENDTAKTSGALLASPDSTKTFTYNNGQLSFEVSAFGSTSTVKMEKISDTPPDLSDSAEGEPKQPEQAAPLKIGETWVVEGQWELTVTGVTETQDRNEYSDKTPGAVYIVDFTYKNIGYEDESGLMDGLFFNMGDSIIDSAGKMGYSYPGTITKYPTETPVGASCDAQVCIGVDNPGTFTLIVTSYDGNRQKQNATFEVTVG